MLLSVVRARQLAGAVPARPIVLCFTADEEAGGHQGAEVLVRDHPEEFEGVTDAVGEVGGFSTTVRGRRLYLLETAERGHGLDAADRPRPRRARLDGQPRQRRHPPRPGGGADRRPRVAGAAHPGDGGAARHRRRPRRHPGHPRQRRRTLVEEFGPATRMLGGVLRNSTNPTMLAGRLQGERHPDRGDRPRRRPLPARLRGRVLRDAARAGRRRVDIDMVSHQQPLGVAVRGRPGARHDPLDPRRGRGRASSRRT